MDSIPTPPQNNQKENEQIKINVPPPGALKQEPQKEARPPETRDTLYKIGVPPTPDNKFQEIKEPAKKIDAPNAFPSAMPLGYGAENNKSFKIVMAGTIIFLTAILIFAVFAFKKNGVNTAPTGSPAVSPSATPTPDANLDTDKDGIPDRIENIIGTNPNNADTDGDTYLDLNEIKNGYSPLIAGAAGKYTPEQWQELKDKIKAADEGFYEKEFSNKQEY